MISKLSVENYALIERLDIEFCGSLNIITGETGAGKSILLGALGLLLGNRCDASALGDRDKNCVVEGVFEIGGYELEDFFAENDLDYDPVTIIRRMISPAGKSRAYVNDLPVQQITLKELGSYLIDIHSQHQSLLLAEDGFRISMLDSVAGHRELMDGYAKAYHTLRSAEKELVSLREDAARAGRDHEWLKYQAEELAAAGLYAGEQQELEGQQAELAHAGQIGEAISMATDYLEEDETGILSRLKAIEQKFSQISGYYGRAADLVERIKGLAVELREIDRELSGEAGRIDSDPGRLEQIDDRLDTLYSLQQKHKVSSVEELIALRGEYERRLALIEDSGEAVARLEAKIVALNAEASAMASKISAGRRKAAAAAGKYVEEVLEGLGMPGNRFAVEVCESQSLRATGRDNVRFLFSANKDIEPAPVEKIASGGEISRLMLALKSLMAKSGSLPTIIFDEIDSGVSGRIADAMGNIINQLACQMQVINITHLPQVACKGDCHFYVYKQTGDGGSRTLIRRLSQQERIEEIAKMLSGSATTEAAVQQARLLLGL